MSVLTTTPPSWDQIPAYLLGLGEKVENIEQLLNSNVPQKCDMPEKPSDVPEIAEFTKLEEVTIYKHVRNRTIPFHRQGRRLYFFKSEIVQWIKCGRAVKKYESEINAEADFLAAQNKRHSKRSLVTSNEA